jgi:hypothetical protein
MSVLRIIGIGMMRDLGGGNKMESVDDIRKDCKLCSHKVACTTTIKACEHFMELDKEV